MGDHLPGAITNRTRARDREKTLLVTNLSAAGTLLAGFWPAAGGRTRAMTLDANLGAADLNI
jgi:hypothetical protein